MKVRLLVAYVGTRYVGWQRQPNGKSVQEVLESALGRIYGEPVQIRGAGRTDAGVHAAGQVTHFIPPKPKPDVSVLPRILNHLLPADITVTGARVAPDSFDARRSATARTYVYRILTSPIPDPFRAPYVWHYPVACKISIGSFRAAARTLVGRRDFSAFTIQRGRKTHTRRNLKRVAVKKIGDEWVLTFVADGFMHRMVRRMVAYLMDRALDKAVTEPKYSAPPSGLCLMRVSYK